MGLDVLGSNRIHVVNEKIAVNLVTIDSEIAAVVAKDDESSNILPLLRSIEPLVDPTVEPEGGSSDLSTKREILKTFLECLKTP